MHCIKPLSSLTEAEIRTLAQAAAERGENLEDANPFKLTQKAQRDQFAIAFLERQDELQPAD